LLRVRSRTVANSQHYQVEFDRQSIREITDFFDGFLAIVRETTLVVFSFFFAGNRAGQPQIYARIT
jgi:hypothetical protein